MPQRPRQDPFSICSRACYTLIESRRSKVCEKFNNARLSSLSSNMFFCAAIFEAVRSKRASRLEFASLQACSISRLHAGFIERSGIHRSNCHSGTPWMACSSSLSSAEGLCTDTSEYTTMPAVFSCTTSQPSGSSGAGWSLLRSI